jgi:branched-chain amino acid transport system permease protein
MGTFIQVTVNGLASGALYAALLIGILLIYQVSRVVNFAQGQFAMIAGLLSYSLISGNGVALWLAIAIATVAVAGIAFGEKLLTDIIGQEGVGYQFILPLGVFLGLTALGQAVLHSGQASNYPAFATKTFIVDGAYIDLDVLIIIAAVVAIVAAVFYVLQRTPIGLQIRAVAADTDVAETLGINAGRVRTGVWICAGVLAAGAGVLIANQVPVDAFYVIPFLINALVAGIFGGLHRILAPIAVAFGLGVLENWIVFQFGAAYNDVVVYGLAIVVLGVAPVRWFTEQAEARA